MWGGGVDADEGMGARAHKPLEVPRLLANGRGSVDQGVDFLISLREGPCSEEVHATPPPFCLPCAVSKTGERRARHHPHAPPPLRRIKFKQESAALKAELQKFQLESKTGNKGMELATKEVDALK